MRKTVYLNSETETIEFANKIGNQVKGGECFEFISDLGGGKTTFTRGLVSGMGSTDLVSSPSFTIGKQYSSGDITIYHYDFYRLQDPGVVKEELQEALNDENSVIIVEWAETVRDVLPENRVVVELQKQPDNPEQRICELEFDKSREYLFEGSK